MTAAGLFRRTPLERSDQRVSWERSDEAFFAAGACHILAQVCRDAFPDRPIGLTALFLAGEDHPSHVYATWRGWAFDFAGWRPEPELLRVNAAFEGRPVEGRAVTVDLVAFARAHHHRLPHEYWRDPVPRARAYLNRYTPPWETASEPPIGSPD